MKKRVLGFGAASLAALSGCGAGGVTDLLALDPGEVVGISRAADTGAPTGEQTCSRTLPDQALAGRGNGNGNGNGRPGGPPPGLSRWRIGQGISRSVRVSVPEGASLPASFTLTNIALALRISDGARSAERTVTVAGPVDFTRAGQSDVYTTRTDLNPEVSFTDGSFATVHAILTTAPSPNTVTVSLRYDASPELPAGATLRFALQRGKGHLQ